jgi:hypothetical protein
MTVPGQLAYRQLIGYFDVLRPVLLLDLRVCRVAYDKFLGLTGVVDLDEFDTTVEECLEYFTEYAKEVTPLINILAQSKIMLGLRIFLLDVLTSLVILVRGDIKEKAYLLFKWYNFSKTNLLSELEHTLLIVRAAKCLHQLKLVGLIEITREDAKYIALSARTVVPKDGSKITFVPGLHLSEFTAWIEDGKIGKAFVTAFRVLERLSDTLVALQNKVTALHHVVAAKVLHEERQIHIPSKEILRTMKNDAPILILNRYDRGVSICVSLNCVSGSTTAGYIKLEKLIPMESPLFEIPSSASERIYPRHLFPSRCCHKYYTLTSFLTVPMVTFGKSGLARADIEKLDPAHDYVISPYTTHEEFCSIHIKAKSTVPQPVWLHRSIFPL